MYAPAVFRNRSSALIPDMVCLLSTGAGLVIWQSIPFARFTSQLCTGLFFDPSMRTSLQEERPGSL